MGQYDLFRVISQSYLTTKERDVNQIKYDILFDFDDSPSFDSVLINNISKGVHIIDENAITKNLNKKRLLCKSDENIAVGDQVYWGNNYWICTNIDSDNAVQVKGIIEKTNNTLKFYKNHILFQVPCIVNKGNINMDENKFISIAADEYILVCPNASDSSNIDLNTRFILTGSAYKVVGIDNISNVGLLNIRVKEDVVVEDDNVELGIANYYSNQIIVDTSTADITITPLDTNIKVGKSVTYTARFTDDGIENNLVHFNWELSNVDGSNNIYATIVSNYDNKSCTITGANSYSAIGKIINIKISLVENPTRFIEKQFKITSLI